MSAEEVANAFVNHFYQTFDGGVDALAGLYVSKHIGFHASRETWSFIHHQCRLKMSPDTLVKSLDISRR